MKALARLLTTFALLGLAPAPADNSWAIALPRAFAARNKLATLEDFAGYVNRGGRVKLAASAEFVESPGALPMPLQSIISRDAFQAIDRAPRSTEAWISTARRSPGRWITPRPSCSSCS